MNKSVFIGDIEIDVEYSATPYRPATWDDPACGGEVEIESASVGGVDVLELLSDRVIDRITDKLEEELADDLRDIRESAEMDRAEAEAEFRLLEAA